MSAARKQKGSYWPSLPYLVHKLSSLGDATIFRVGLLTLGESFWKQLCRHTMCTHTLVGLSMVILSLYLLTVTMNYLLLS